MIHAPRLFTLALIALVLAGCAGKPQQSTTTGVADKAEPWFCQPGAVAGDWECMRSAELARRPVPTRAPVIEPPRTPSQPAFDALENKPAEQRRQPATPTAVPSSPPVDQPRHVQLAYHPDRPVSLLDLPADFWVAQLVALSSPEDLEQYALAHGMQGMSAARVMSGDALYYVLLLGIYETREIAQQAITDLPPPFDTHKPWLRTVGSLQRAIRLADASTSQ